jgi:ankyrin repeat protein
LYNFLMRGHVGLTWFLLKHSADVSAKDSSGDTLLHQVLYSGHIDLTRFLIEQGADMSAKNKYWSTPLRQALSGGHLDLAWFATTLVHSVPESICRLRMDPQVPKGLAM